MDKAKVLKILAFISAVALALAGLVEQWPDAAPSAPAPAEYAPDAG